MMKFHYVRNLTIAGSLFLAAGAVQAQVTKSGAPAAPAAAVGTGAPDPAKVPLIEDLFRLTKPDGMVVQARSALGNAAQQAFNAEVRKFDDPAKYQADYQKVQGQLMAIINTRLDWTKMKPELVKVYSDSFTKEELAGITAFYKSPAGQAEMQKMPQVAYKTNLLGQQQLAGAQPELQKVMSDAINNVKQKSQASHATPGAPAAPKK